MRINQVYIRQYGPLQRDLELSDEINVIRGPNESGKSLLVEGLLKQLNEGSVPNSVIDGSPEGFVEVSDGVDSEALGDGTSLQDFCAERYSQEIRPEDLRNVFVIRSADLDFHEGDNFYTHITDKLTGRRVEDIDEIRDALVEEGRLKPKELEVSNKDDFHDAEDQLSAAESLRTEISAYVAAAGEQDLAAAESEYFSAQRRVEQLEERIGELEEAKQKEEMEERIAEIEEDKETIKGNLEGLAGLPDEEDLREIDERLEALSEQEGRQDELQERKESTVSLAKWSLGAGVAAFGILVAVGFPSVGAVSTLLFLAGAGYFWYRANGLSDEIAELRVTEENILSDARAAGLSFETRDEIRGEISDIQRDREELAGENQGKQAVLKRELDFDAETMEETVQQADAALDELRDEIDDSIEIAFDQQELNEAKEEYEAVAQKRDGLDQDLADHNRQLQGFRQRAYELDFGIFVGERFDLEVENLAALEALEDRLDEFVQAIEQDAAASRVAIEIFADIQDEEQEETAELFEAGSRATEIFEDITGGRYDTVTYDNEENQLKVVKSTGEVFVPGQLSDGTRDQLYLSIRVALGEEILEGGAGFFIMDDAFLTADPHRLEKQADVVETLADEGWQIIYLSSKEDAITELSDRTENDVIELPALE